MVLVSQCPLEKSHENTLYFESLAEQDTYFHATLYNRAFTKQYYQRVNKNTIRVQANVESLYDYTYMSFKNINFGNKWFYAFIDKIEYINNITAEITYTIDVMQTWMFDYVLMPCFVEREHSATDEIGDNIVEEKLATGEYVADSMDFPEPNYFGGYSLYIWATFQRDNADDYHDVGGRIINNGTQPFYTGLAYTEFPLTAAGITDAINWVKDIPPLKLNGLVSMNIGPRLIEEGGTTKTISYPLQRAGLRRADGQAPKNKKLYTYPYCALYVTNNIGKSAVYRYEFFDDTDTPGFCQFNFFTDVTPNPSTIIVPQKYKGVIENYDEALELTGYPQVAYNVDSYKAWLAQTGSNIAGSLLGSAFIGAAGVGFGIPGFAVSAGMGIIHTVSRALEGEIEALKPPQAQGQQDNMALLSLGKLKFGFMPKHITPEYVSMIDDYFSMYGYATKKLKRPNITARPEWNYVKTVGCEIEGAVPSDDALEIQSIYDKGVRFWRWPEHYLRYDYDNSPVTEQNQGG